MQLVVERGRGREEYEGVIFHFVRSFQPTYNFKSAAMIGTICLLLITHFIVQNSNKNVSVFVICIIFQVFQFSGLIFFHDQDHSALIA